MSNLNKLNSIHLPHILNNLLKKEIYKNKKIKTKKLMIYQSKKRENNSLKN